MSRGNSKTKRHELMPDHKFQNPLVTQLMNYVMLNGKKTVAEKIVYGAFDIAAKQLGADPMDLFTEALKNVGPIVEVKSKRIGGANYQVPMEVSRERRNTLAIRWILAAARSQKGRPMALKLGAELVSAYNGEGAAVKKKEDTHRMAEANKAFAHFARF